MPTVKLFCIVVIPFDVLKLLIDLTYTVILHNKNLCLILQEYKASSKIPLPVALTPGGCQYNDAHFSPDMTYYALECHGPEVPRVWLFRSVDNTMLGVLNDNEVCRWLMLQGPCLKFLGLHILVINCKFWAMMTISF